jgi:hypothetical protein
MRYPFYCQFENWFPLPGDIPGAAALPHGEQVGHELLPIPLPSHLHPHYVRRQLKYRVKCLKYRKITTYRYRTNYLLYSIVKYSVKHISQKFPTWVILTKIRLVSNKKNFGGGVYIF